MNVTEVILVLFLAWQISAMPIPMWLATAFFSVDGEEFYTQSNWVENKFSSLSKYGAVIVFLLEFLKGTLAMSMMLFIHTDVYFFDGLIPLQYVLALVVLVGHSFPIYAEFQQSRSMGAYFGIFFGLWAMPTLIAVALFLMVVVILKKVTFSSVLVALSSLVIITFMAFDLKAVVIALALSSVLMLSNIQFKSVFVRA